MVDGSLNVGTLLVVVKGEARYFARDLDRQQPRARCLAQIPAEVVSSHGVLWVPELGERLGCKPSA